MVIIRKFKIITTQGVTERLTYLNGEAGELYIIFSELSVFLSF